ncbi:amidohydrolase family protein [Nocardia sp. NPDC024068]|uniref:amidohydrolase family protein n=1 Tax=Nocardia sp. NPDC024068 TaxID=3157197 RepID=UPI0033DF75C3
MPAVSAIPEVAADEAYLAAFRQRLGLPGLVDVHTHFMPHRVLRKVWAYFDDIGPMTGRPWPITYRADESVRLETLRRFGLRAFTALVYPHRPEMAAWLNEWTAEFAEQVPECLHTATFFPEPTAADYVRTALERGAQVFKAHIQVGAYDPRDPLLDPVWGMLSDAGVPTVIHCGSGPAPGVFTGPGPVAEVLDRHPRLPLIVAHMGMPEYTEFLDLADRFTGVALDTTMAFTDFAEIDVPFPAADRQRLVDVGDRIMFGSDFPNIPYPYRHAFQALERLELGDEWLRRVCYRNAAERFGLA